MKLPAQITELNQFFYIFIGTAIAIILGNSIYYAILSSVDNVILPTLIKILGSLGVDTTDWQYKKYHWTEFIGDFMTFSLAILMAFLLWVQFRKGTELMNKSS